MAPDLLFALAQNGSLLLLILSSITKEMGQSGTLRVWAERPVTEGVNEPLYSQNFERRERKRIVRKMCVKVEFLFVPTVPYILS